MLFNRILFFSKNFPKNFINSGSFAYDTIIILVKIQGCYFDGNATVGKNW